MRLLKKYWGNGRGVLGIVPMANEMVEVIVKKRASGILCIPDVEKAYNRVDCNFLIYLLLSKGFGSKCLHGFGGESCRSHL